MLRAPLGKRPGRLALEVDHVPGVLGAQHLPEVKVTVMADELTDGSDRREPAEDLPDRLATTRDRRNGLVVGKVVEDLFDLVVDRRGQQPDRLRARGFGCEGGVVPVAREGAVHCPDHRPETPESGEERARAG